MPFPFNGRDYVVKYDIERSKNKWILTYVVHPSAPVRKHTRLPNATGIWELKKIDQTKRRQPTFGMESFLVTFQKWVWIEPG